MRVCLVSREYAPFQGAGIGTYVSQMARALAGAGHDVHVLTEAHPRIDTLRPTGRVHHHAVDLDTGVASMEGFAAGAIRHAVAVHAALAPLHDAHRFDYIEFPDYGGEGYAALAARRTTGAYAGAVIGLRLHTPLYECIELNAETWLNRERAYSIAIEDDALRMADVLVSPCTSLLDNVRARLGARVPEGVVVPYPFDVDAVERDLGRAPAERNDRATVLYFGRLERRKGVHLQVEAASRLLDEGRDVRVRFIGGDTQSGPMGTSMASHLRRLIRPEHQGRFVFERRRERARLGGAIRGAACCCFPSLWENFPNACLEAMAMGALVVGSDAGGMSEMIEHGETGLLTRAGSVDDLAAQLRRALDDAPLREQARTSAPAAIRQLCDPPKIVRRMQEIVERHAPSGTPRARASNAGKSDRPSVSIVIPFHNMAAWLPQTLESLDKQTCREFETILVDDGSTDRASCDLVESLARDRPDIRIVRQANRGLSAARNAGIRAAGGRWILPLDADDLLAPTYIEQTLGAARRWREEEGTLALVTTFVASFLDGAAGVPWIWTSLGLQRDLLGVLNVCSPCTALIDRKRLLEVGGYDEWLGAYEDWDLYCSMAERGWASLVVPEPLFLYRQRHDSMRRISGEPWIHRYRTYIQAKHPSLALRPDFAMRFLAGELRHAEMVCIENPRYQIVDRINKALKRTPIHGPLKHFALRVMGDGER